MSTIKKKEVANKIYKDYDYSKSVDFIKNQVGNRKKILDVNCRNGELLSLLKAEGFETFGITPSRKHAKLAESQVSCPIQKKSILKFKTKEKFDIITSLYSACNRYKNYIGIDLALNHMQKCLNDDGLIILELIKTVKPNLLRTENKESKIKRKKTKLKILNVYKVEDKKFKFKNKYKIFDVEKIKKIAEKNGLKVVDVFRDYSVKIPDEYGDNFQVVLAKNTEETQKEAKKRKRQFVTKKGKVKVFSRKIYFAMMALMACTGIFVGTLVGDFYNSNFANVSSFEYSLEKINAAKAVDSEKIASINTLNAPDKYNPTIVFMYAEQHITDYNIQIIEKGGLQVMGVNQTVANITTITETKRTKVAASVSSLISLATKTTYDVNSDTVLQQNGKPTDLEFLGDENEGEFRTNWSEPKNMTVEEYQNEWGVIPAWISPYIICSSTVIDFETQRFSKQIVEDEELYTAKINLKTKYNTTSKDEHRLMAYTYYVKQISAMSGVLVTDFESCEITFSIDKNYRIRKVEINETYNVRYGVIPVTCPSKLTQTYNYL